MQHGDLHAAAEGGGHRGGEGIGGDVRLELLGHGDGAESLAYDELHLGQNAAEVLKGAVEVQCGCGGGAECVGSCEGSLSR